MFSSTHVFVEIKKNNAHVHYIPTVGCQHFAKEMPYVKFILPTAPSNPVTMNMGMSMPSWYDITGLDERSNENCNGLDRSVSTITNILDNEHTSTGLPYQRMILAGFSQGGALSLFTAFQLPNTIAGIVCLSGYLPAAKQFRIHPGNEHIPVLHCHGTQDMVVAYPLAQKSKTKIQEMGCTNYTIQSYPIGHTVDMKELADVLKFLKERLPPDEAYKIKVKDSNEMSVKELREAIKKAGLSHKAVGLMEKSEFVQLLQNYRDGKL
jgi:predicted esterase